MFCVLQENKPTDTCECKKKTCGVFLEDPSYGVFDYFFICSLIYLLLYFLELTSLHSQSAKSSSSTIVLVGENKDVMLPVDAQCDLCPQMLRPPKHHRGCIDCTWKKEYLCHPTYKLITSFMEMDPNFHYTCVYQLPPEIKPLLSLPKTSLKRLLSPKSVNHLAIWHDRDQDLTSLTCRNPPPWFLMFHGSSPLIQ